MKRLKKVVVGSDYQINLQFVDATGQQSAPLGPNIQVHTSDPEIAMMQGARLVPTGRKFGKVKVFMVDTAALKVLDVRLLEVVKADVKAYAPA